MLMFSGDVETDVLVSTEIKVPPLAWALWLSSSVLSVVHFLGCNKAEMPNQEFL